MSAFTVPPQGATDARRILELLGIFGDEDEPDVIQTAWLFTVCQHHVDEVRKFQEKELARLESSVFAWYVYRVPKNTADACSVCVQLDSGADPDHAHPIARAPMQWSGTSNARRRG